MVKGLQVSNANGVAIPANWPQNELVGDEVIIPPATDEKISSGCHFHILPSKIISFFLIQGYTGCIIKKA